MSHFISEIRSWIAKEKLHKHNNLRYIKTGSAPNVGYLRISEQNLLVYLMILRLSQI